VVLVAHPVQILTEPELRALADVAFPRIERLLTDSHR